jgi:hypothetical protein
MHENHCSISAIVISPFYSYRYVWSGLILFDPVPVRSRPLGRFMKRQRESASSSASRSAGNRILFPALRSNALANLGRVHALLHGCHKSVMLISVSDPVLVGVMSMAGVIVSAFIANCDKITTLPFFKKRSLLN